jgi:hypothetical protein
VACHAGADPAPHPSALDTVEQYLKMGGVREPCARWIIDAIIRNRVVSSGLVTEIREQLRQDAAADPSPERRTEDQIMAVFTRVVGALQLDRGSVVRQIADGLEAAGYQGVEVTGPMGQAMAFVTPAGVVLEVVVPGTDPAPVLELIRDLADFHLGSSHGRARSRLLALGVDPADHGSGRKPGAPARKLVQARPGADLVGHATQWVEDYGGLTGYAHRVLSTLDCTRAIGRAKPFLPHPERFARVVVGAPVPG